MLPELWYHLMGMCGVQPDPRLTLLSNVPVGSALLNDNQSPESGK
jgi:hypothetical protein